MSNTVQDRIKMVFQRFIINDSELDAVFHGAPILDSLSLDSLVIVHMVTDLEKEFGIRFELERLELIFENIETLESFLVNKQ